MRRVIDERSEPQLGGALNPVDIIDRAARLVPEDRVAGPDRPVARAPLLDRPENELDREEDAAAAPLPTARSRRRPLRLLVARLLASLRFTLRYAAPAAVLVGLPVWLWTGGHADEARSVVERETRHWALWVTEQLGLRVTSVRVQGRGRTETEALRAAVAIDPGTPMLDVNIETVRQRVEHLPWVERAFVRRELPHRLVIRLIERTPIARIRTGDDVNLVDASGTVIRAAPDEAHSALPVIEGAGAADNAAPLIALLESRPEIGRRVVAARRHGNRRWDLRFDSGLLVMLPDGFERAAWNKLEDLQRRLRLLDRGYAVVDMRLPDRLVIRPAQDGDQRESQG